MMIPDMILVSIYRGWQEDGALRRVLVPLPTGGWSADSLWSTREVAGGCWFAVFGKNTEEQNRILYSFKTRSKNRFIRTFDDTCVLIHIDF